MTGSPVADAKSLHFRFLFFTNIHSVGAACMEPAAFWRIDGAWHIPFKDDPLFFVQGIRDWYGR